MVIRYFNIIGVTVLKMEADSPLIIHELPIPLQFRKQFNMIGR
jgi:hypothetical protein